MCVCVCVYWTVILNYASYIFSCLEVSAINQPSVEYMKQLLLNALQRSLENIMSTGNKSILPQEKFNIANVIECCRTSENPQTHHQALLLLGKAAAVYPVSSRALVYSISYPMAGLSRRRGNYFARAFFNPRVFHQRQVV